MLAEGKNVDNFTVGGFDMNYGWDYKDELVKVYNGAPAFDLIKADKAEYDGLPAGKVKLRFTTNHDHGSQEVGYPEPINFFKYVPVDWTTKPEVYQEYKKLIGLYNDCDALRKGEMTAYPDDDVLVFEKTDDDERYLVLVNVRNETKTAQVPQSWVGRDAEDKMTDGNIRLDSTIALEPFQYLILK